MNQRVVFQLALASLLLLVIQWAAADNLVIHTVLMLCLLGWVVSLMYRGRTFDGQVVGVSDGDTIQVERASGERVVIRLAGIDAPEKNQPHGLQSAKALEDFAWKRRVMVRTVSIDRYGRTVGVVYTAHGTCLNYWMIQQGWAWYYADYSQFLSKATKGHWLAAEADARQHGRGLWCGNRPISPQKWRQRDKHG